MKKWKQVVMLTALTLGITFATKVDADAAAQIQNVTQTDASKSSVKIQWDASLGTNDYKIELSEDNSNWVLAEHSTSAYYTFNNLSAGKTYYARVTGYGDYSWSSKIFSSETAATSEVIEVVTAPNVDNFEAYQSAASTSSIKVTADGATGANYYQLVINANNADVVIGDSNSNTISSNKTKLNPASSYYVNVYACRKSASTGFVAYVSYDYDRISCKTVTPKITASNFGISNAWTNLDSYKFFVNRTGDFTFDGFELQFKDMKGKVKKKVATSSVLSSVSVDDLNGTFYQYRVRTYVQCAKKKAYSAWSDYKYLGIPGSLSGNSTKSRIKCNWSAVSGASKFEVYISTKENSGYKKVKTVSTKSRSITISKYKNKALKKGTTYYVKVVACAKSGKKTVKSDVNRVGSTTIPRY